MKPKTIRDAIYSPIGSIGGILKSQGELKARAILVLLIGDLIDFFNISRSMSDSQVASTSDLIIECYPYLTPEDFHLCFKNMKLNKYIKLFEGIDGNKIIECIHLYDQERELEVIKINSEKNYSYKQEINQPNLALKEIYEKLGLKNKEKKVIPPREKTTTEKLFYYLFEEFNKVYKEQYPAGSKEPAMKIVRYNNSNVEVEEYCNRRFNVIINFITDDFVKLWESQEKPFYKTKTRNIELKVDCVLIDGIEMNKIDFLNSKVEKYLELKYNKK